MIDSHCHAWTHWPYQPPVPDPESRGRVEQLLDEMDHNGVELALVVCAQIEHNPQNNAYIAEQVQRFPGRLHQLVDLDSEWSSTYHTPGAVERLRRMAAQWPIKGFTHYLRRDDDGAWLHGDEGQAVFRFAVEQRLVASISCLPHQQAAIRKVAQAFPQVPILCHHMGFVMAGLGEPQENLKEVLASARLPNIFIKVSGFAYAAQVKWDFPYTGTHWIVKAIYEHFGAQRLCWGSDYPVVRFFMTYRQALEAFRTHCAFIPEADQEWVLNGTAQKLLGQS